MLYSTDMGPASIQAHTLMVTMDATRDDLSSTQTASQVKHVDAELVFWRRLQDQKLVTDFTKAKPEQCMTAMKEPDEKHPARIHDIRGHEARFTLEQNGFQYVWNELAGLESAADEKIVKSVIIPQTEELVKKMTRATRTITFTHRVRCFSDDEAMLANNRAPAHSVHSDFTTAGALHHLESVITDTGEREQILQGRVQIINVWRPLKTVRRDPLAICDWATLDWQKDRMANRLILPTGWNELGKYAFNPTQQWYYLAGQQPQEALIFKQFDNWRLEEGGVTLPHSAFVVPDSVDGPARESIEIKMFAFS